MKKRFLVTVKNEISTDTEEVEAETFFAQFKDATFLNLNTKTNTFERVAYFSEVISVQELPAGRPGAAAVQLSEVNRGGV